MKNEITAEQRRFWAQKLNASDKYLYQCLTGRRDMGPIEARRIESESGCVITRKMLCQKTWRGIWPELAEPPATQAQEAINTVAKQAA